MPNARTSKEAAIEAAEPKSATASRKKIYPRHVEGRFHRLRNGISVVLQALLFVAPWVSWRGQQAILFDVPNSRLFIFDLVLHPQETYFLLLVAIIASLTLFASAAVAGRMWCGYACPQTIFTQSFIFVERLFEGDRAQRLRLDRRLWDADKVLRKVGKWAVWTVMGIWLGITFAGYYVPIRELVADLLTGHPGNTTILVVAFFAAFSLFDFGWFREQFCIYICPYARFQGSMLDPESVIVAYDASRGDPRGKLKSQEKAGCIDCTMCVQACPMGIDIRNGLQLECIACAACLDACDEVMDKVGRPKGLVRYTSLQELQGKERHLVRPRLIVYAVLLTALCGLFWWLLLSRSPLGLSALRQSPGGQMTYAIAPDGRISNPYLINLTNRTREEQTVYLSVEGFAGAELVTTNNPCVLKPGEVTRLTAVILHGREGLRPVQKVKFQAKSGSITVEKETNFLAPLQ